MMMRFPLPKAPIFDVSQERKLDLPSFLTVGADITETQQGGQRLITISHPALIMPAAGGHNRVDSHIQRQMWNSNPKALIILACFRASIDQHTGKFKSCEHSMVASYNYDPKEECYKHMTHELGLWANWWRF